MYCSGRAVEEADCAKNKSVVREGLEDLFYHYGVDLVLQAHEEQYERLYPVLKGVVVATNYTNPRAPVQIVAGFDNKTQPGYGRLLVINSTHAHWEFRSGPGEEDVVDSVLLVQEHHGKFQLSDLPQDVEQEIDQHLVANGGKPGVLDVDDPERDKEHMLDADAMRRIVIGASFGGVIGLVLIILLIMKLRRRGKRRVARRWDSMDYKYGKTKLYAPGNDDDDEVDDDNDFEVDIPDGSLQTTKLINGK
nr:hypothetical protein BaRGS_004690 [Batillaria attramentaria]